ncbi:transglycosylase domain-containing protein [Arcobacter sp. FWKO B]|uniref:transglycosylase domain-containing protein n=1 Tax=Arcobacter sp. FWKO B TaxID=2593672 RepID=UPI0018A3586D|nr:PBP1A family penicillin-binding protein [Arcobacter sp. FWKO B]QOG11657.1 PBP1A family penicillin-binding protein [Arcobacter sp. FWKO B]
MILRFLLTVIITAIIGVVLFVLFIYSQIRFDLDKIVDYKPRLTTQFFDRNGELVANIFDNEHRILVPYDEIPSRLIEALVAIEDTHFFEHNGINIEAISRAMIKNIQSGKFVEGASTLTQQLVKTMLLTREKKIDRKIKEAILSITLEQILTKEEILFRYFNEIYFGHGYYGVKTASLGYFKKELYELNLKEIAMLVSLPRAPSFYDPTKNYKFSLARANVVLKRMNDLGWISDQEYAKYVEYQPTVYDETLTQNKAPYVIDEVLRTTANTLPDIRTGGYNIELTIDLKTQQIAQNSLVYGYNQIKQRDSAEKFSQALNGAMVVLESKTGEILALVGGIDYNISSFNRATQTKRQPGSSAKPFFYQIALDLGYATNSSLADISRTYQYTQGDEEKVWQPTNYENNLKGFVPLKEALTYSRNLATINLVGDIGIDIVYDKILSYGFKNIPKDMSISLGSFGISPLELSHMYTMFSNNGQKVTPMLMKSLTNKNGQTIVFETQKEYVTSPEQIYLMTDILKNVVTSGTGRGARVNGIELAGKTGTTNSNVDNWFCGYSPSIQVVVWFGNDDNTPMSRTETGGRSTAQVFGYFYDNILKIYPQLPRTFEVPSGVYETTINGKKEYYTDTSRLETPQSTPIPEQNKFIF